MNKKLTKILVISAFLLCITASVSFTTSNVFAEEICVKSKSVYMIDYDSQNVLYSKNEDEKLPIASMCKIMTLNIIFDEIENGNIDIDGKIFVSENASAMGGSQIFLDANTEYPVRELIKGIVVASANDSCVAFAEAISGSEEVFTEKMNEKAKGLGMNDTVFTNCTGLPKVGQFSTAKDVSKMFSELLTHKNYFEFSNIWVDEIHHSHDRITQISNTNKLIRFYKGCDSGKTGYTSEAGHCLCCSAKRDNMRVICVVISSPDSKTRFKEVSTLLNNAFANYTVKRIVDKETPLSNELNIENGKENKIQVYPEENFFMLNKRNEKISVEISIKLKEKIQAPVNKNQVVGKIEVYKDGILIKEINVITNQNVEKNGYLENIQKGLESLITFN